MTNFAYGKDKIGDCACPAVQAGFSPSAGDKTTAVAEYYDYVVAELGYTNAESTISEEKAKHAWLETIKQLRKKDARSEMVEIGEEIAEDLGWGLPDE